MQANTTKSTALLLTSIALAAALAGCAVPKHRAPVEDRTVGAPVKPGAASPPTPAAAEAKPALPGAENDGKPGYYTVKPGDTLIRIALENGQNWRDIARWSNVENPNRIEVGQVLRVAPPATEPSGVSTKPISTAKVESRPLDSKPSAPVAVPAASAPSTPSSAAVPAAAAGGDDEVAWAWPASGGVLAGFDEQRNKGLDISGKAGDPVYAAADGRVAYAGSGLRGFGNLVIIKHNATYLTAYAHNQALLVKEDQVVRKGQKIAEMGSSDADQVKLHFEVRKQGKPIDPARLLPAR
jgi:lipoprotein NlpD